MFQAALRKLRTMPCDRKAGFRPSDRVEFKGADRVITIVPKLSPDEEQDERENRDPKVRATIEKSYQDFLAGKNRPIEALFAERVTVSRGES
jgi:hypothetical protein